MVNVPKIKTGIIIETLSPNTSPRTLYVDAVDFSTIPLNSHSRQLIDGRLKIPPTASKLVPISGRLGWVDD
jgi:hypothetical protein